MLFAKSYSLINIAQPILNMIIEWASFLQFYS